MIIARRFLLICVGFLSGASLCAANGFGRCNETYFLTEAFSCEQRFFKALFVKGPSDECWNLYDVHLIQCYNNTLWTCLHDTHDKWRDAVDIGLFMLKAYGHAHLFCSKEKNFTIQELPDKLKKHKPCTDEYVHVGRNCTTKFIEMLANQRNSPLLCSAYEEAMNCTFRVSKQFCKQNIDFPEGLVRKNPFCNKTKTTYTGQPAQATHNPLDKVSTSYDDHSKSDVTSVRSTASTTAHETTNILVMVGFIVLCYL